LPARTNPARTGKTNNMRALLRLANLKARLDARARWFAGHTPGLWALWRKQVALMPLLMLHQFFG
jgi:hypothetical protein